MGIEIRLPQITGATEKEQLAQIKSYLYQFAEQLQWGLQNVNTTNNAVVVQEMAKSLYPTGNTGSGTVQDPLATFAAIKALIIKSADIVDAYYDVISKKLEGLYVASSDFGTFVYNTEQTIKAESTRITQNFENVQTILPKTDGLSKDIAGVKGDLEGINAYIKDTKAYIISGLLYEDDKGDSVYGIEVGQTDKINGEEVFNRFARFTADRLSFYDSFGNEAAYISGFRLYILHAEIKGTLKLGEFRVNTEKGLTVNWEGSE